MGWEDETSQSYWDTVYEDKNETGDTHTDKHRDRKTCHSSQSCLGARFLQQ